MKRTLPRVGLTPIQYKLLSFIGAFIGQHGYSPSYAEMLSHMGYSAKSGMNRLVCELEKRGHITRLPNHGRSIALAAHSEKITEGSVACETAPFGEYADALKGLKDFRA